MDELLTSIVEKELPDDRRIFAVRMGPKDLVTVRGSVLGGWEVLPSTKQEAAIIFARLLDAGTKKYPKIELRGSLAKRGAEISFSVGSDRTFFNASCLPENLSFVLSVIADCLANSTLPVNEFNKARKRIMSGIKNNATDTAHQAHVALNRMMYDSKHPNFSDTDQERLKNLGGITHRDVTAFQKYIGKGGLTVAVTGDIDAKKTVNEVERAFNSLPERTLKNQEFKLNGKKPKAEEKRITIAGKANIDVLLGASLPIRYGDPQYLATVLATDLLGGSFTGHLMATVRERDGLTYGIYSGFASATLHKDGYFQISTSFAPELYEKGVATTITETKKYFARGITDAAVASKKEEFAGGYVLGLSTTSGLANRLHAIGVRHQPLSQLTQYIEDIKAVTKEEIKTAAATIPIDALSIAAAGTFAKK